MQLLVDVVASEALNQTHAVEMLAAPRLLEYCSANV
jgi:hypothetical protein